MLSSSAMTACVFQQGHPLLSSAVGGQDSKKTIKIHYILMMFYIAIVRHVCDDESIVLFLCTLYQT